LIFDLLLSAVVIEIFFLNFNKVPFTCSYPRDKFRLAALAVGYFYGFVTYVASMGLLKRWTASAPGHFLVYVIVASAVLTVIGAYRRRVRDRSARVVYQDTDLTGPLSIVADDGYWTVRHEARRFALGSDRPGRPGTPDTPGTHGQNPK